MDINIFLRNFINRNSSLGLKENNFYSRIARCRKVMFQVHLDRFIDKKKDGRIK
jgi:hypothetical protein